MSASIPKLSIEVKSAWTVGIAHSDMFLSSPFYITSLLTIVGNNPKKEMGLSFFMFG